MARIFRRRRFGSTRMRRRRFGRFPRRIIRRRRMRTEVKHLDGTLQDFSIAGSGISFLLTSVAGGITVNGRVGNIIKPHSILIRGQINVDSPGPSTMLRVLLVQDLRGPDAPAVADILQDGAWNGPLARQTLGRFTVLYDRLFGNFPGSAAGLAQRPFKIFRRRRMRPLHYRGILSTDISNGMIYLFCIPSASETTTIDGFARFNYTDP